MKGSGMAPTFIENANSGRAVYEICAASGAEICQSVSTATSSPPPAIRASAKLGADIENDSGPSSTMNALPPLGRWRP